jgi:aminomethyltransferase
MLKRTPLFEAHQKLGARLVEFGGWEMPVQYTSIIDEHQAVRAAAGIFDISHMGEFFVSGQSAKAFLNGVLTNDLEKLAVGDGQYTLMCNESGGTVDDLYAYRIRDLEYFLIVNASRIDADFAWLENQLKKFTLRADVRLQNRSEDFGAIAIQGPRVAEFIDTCVSGRATGGTQIERPSQLKKNQIAEFTTGSSSIWISRTGYTGEDGFEVVAPDKDIRALWENVLRAGHSSGLKPAGLGARDTLRTEMCYPLYGHELDETTSPIEAGLGYFVALNKTDFVGRSVLANQKTAGAQKKCVAFRMTDKSAPPRPHYGIWSGAASPEKIGEVVSGTQSPSLGVGVGLGYVPPQFAKAGTRIEIEIRGKKACAEVVSKPIYKKAV